MKNNRFNPGWTNERIAKLKELAAQGLSASKIARWLGHVSRNAIIGKCRREEIELKDRPSGKVGFKPPGAQKPQVLKPKNPDKNPVVPRKTRYHLAALINENRIQQTLVLLRANGDVICRAANFQPEMALCIANFIDIDKLPSKKFVMAGPLHAEGIKGQPKDSAFGVAVHQTKPVIAVWYCDLKGTRKSQWHLYAQTMTRPNFSSHSTKTMRLEAWVYDDSVSSMVYILRGTPIPKYNKERDFITHSDMPDSMSFDAALKAVGLKKGLDDLLPEFAVPPLIINGQSGISFEANNPFDIQPFMAVTDDRAARILGRDRIDRLER